MKVFYMCHKSLRQSTKTDQSTSWRHEAYEHQTGDEVTESSLYVDENGEQVEFTNGQLFCNCSKTNQLMTWKHVHS